MVVRIANNHLRKQHMPVPQAKQEPRVIVVSGGTDGMGRALALGRAERGDLVVAIGSSPVKGRRLLDDAERIGAADRMHFVQADLSSVAATRRVIGEIAACHDVVDALCLFANRPSPQRVVTREGLERTFALYYLSRYVLGEALAPLLRRSRGPVIVNVAGAGMTKGAIHWDDLQLERAYGAITAQLQAGRANDLLGVAYAAQPGNPARYVLLPPRFHQERRSQHAAGRRAPGHPGPGRVRRPSDRAVGRAHARFHRPSANGRAHGDRPRQDTPAHAELARSGERRTARHRYEDAPRCAAARSGLRGPVTCVQPVTGRAWAAAPASAEPERSLTPELVPTAHHLLMFDRNRSIIDA
jgi:hypothetical protein